MDFSNTNKRTVPRWVYALAISAIAITVVISLLIQPFVAALPSSPPPVDPSRLQAHVKKLSVEFHPRSFDHAAKLDGAAAYIVEQFKETGAQVAIQEVRVDGEIYKNIIARFGTAQGPLLVVGAHYDTADVTPGADDNASGVAGLLELARLLARAPQTRSIELVAYTLEEPPHFRSPHMGSVWHAKSLKAAGREVELMLSMEMIGYFSDLPNSQSYPVAAMKYCYSDRANFIALVGKFGDFGASRAAKAAMSGASELPVYSLNAPVLVQGVDYSDHRSYWSEGYPALMVTDTSFMRNPHYHRPSDTWEKLDYQRMAMVVQGVYAITQAR
jgi:Zn-dependent M28 family amino/carboxypeptidase